MAGLAASFRVVQTAYHRIRSLPKDKAIIQVRWKIKIHDSIMIKHALHLTWPWMNCAVFMVYTVYDLRIENLSYNTIL